MLTFQDLKNGDFVFLNNGDPVAIGTREQGSFSLLHKEVISSFCNAMQAFCYLRSLYETYIAPVASSVDINVKQTTNNLNQYKKHPVLKDMPKDVFFAEYK